MDFKQYDSIDITQHIMAICDKKGIEYNNTKLNKLLYMLYGFVLAKYNFILTNEKPHLWPYGPVFPRVQKNINKQKLISKIITDLDSRVIDILDYIINKCGNFTAGKLSSWSHTSGSPWDACVRLNYKWNTVIDDDLIKSYFKRFFK